MKIVWEKFMRRYIPLYFIVSLILAIGFSFTVINHPKKAEAAAAFVQGKYGNNGIATFTSSVTSGNVIAVGVLWYPAATLTSVTAPCVSGGFTLIDNPTNHGANGVGFAAMAYGVITSSGACAVTANYSAGLVFNEIIAHEISGVNTSSPLDGHAMQANDVPGTGANAVTSGNFTTTQNGDYIFGFSGKDSFDGNALTQGTGFTKRITGTGNLAHSEDKTQSSAGSVASTFTSGTALTTFITGGMALKPAGGTPPPSDTTPPSIPTNLSATAISSSQINLSWTVSTDNVGVSGYRIYRGGVQIGTSATNSYSDSGLTASTQYTYTVSAYDAAGNASSQSSSASATTQAPTPTPPVISSFSASPTSITSGQSSTLSWSVSNATSLSINQGIGAVTGSSQSVSPTLTTIYTLTATNVQGSATANTTITVNVPDTTAPSIPANLSATAISSSQINLSWTASTDAVGVTGYRIYRGGIQIGTSATNSYSDSGLSASTQYSYAVSAYDAAGNSSSQSTSASATTQAASSSGIIPADRLAAWQGSVGVEGGIPNRTTICATLNPGATASQINTALNNCPNGQVVFLNAGTYTLTSTISIPSNKTLRGAGPDITILLFNTTLGSNVQFHGGYTDASAGGISIVSGYTKGSNQLTLSNASGLSAGNFVYISELNDPSIPVDIMGAQACDFCGLYGSNGARARFQLSKVTAVNGNTITISPAMAFTFSSARSPQAHPAPSGGQSYVQYAGVENLTVKNGGTSISDTRVNIEFQGTANSWAKNIKADTCGKRCVDLYIDVARNEVRDSYFTKCLDRYNSDTCYGVQVWNGSFNLVENNIFDNTANGIILSSATGNVFAYNYMYGVHRTASLTDWFWPSNWTHGSHSSYNLWEGNNAVALEWDLYWGSNSHNMAFRNRFTGKDDTINYDLANLQSNGAILTFPNNNYMTDIGNILGASGFSNTYEHTSYNISAGIRPIWATYNSAMGITNTKEFTTTLRHMNYDYFTNSVKHCGDAGEPGCQGGDGSTALLASYYLPSKPSWFGNSAWPAIGPDVAGYTTDIPAKYCYDRGLMPNCLSGTPPPSDTTPPSAPSGLSATAISSSAINLSWTSSTDNVGVTGYRIYRGGVQIGTTITNNYNDNGLNPSTLYSYTVSAYDSAGNTSSLSASVSATTPSGIPVPGDFNSDHIINSLDYSLLNSHWYQTTNISVYDLLADNLINTLDFAILKDNWGKVW